MSELEQSLRNMPAPGAAPPEAERHSPFHHGLVGRLRNLPGMHSLPAVAVTGYGQASDRAKSHAAGFDRHVVKPVGLEDLRTLLASL